VIVNIAGGAAWVRRDATSGNYRSVAWYGVDLTGATASDAGIMRAYNALPSSGGTLFFPAGIYKTVGLTFSTKTVRLLGALGRSAYSYTQSFAASRFVSTSNAPIVQIVGVAARGSVVEHLGFQGSRSSSTAQHGLFLNCAFAAVRSCEFVACGGDGIRCAYLDTAGLWSDVVTFNCGGHGGNFDDTFDTTSTSGADEAVNTFINWLAIGNQKGGIRTSAFGGGFNENNMYGCEFSTNGYSIGGFLGATGGAGVPININHPGHGFVGGNWVVITGANNFNDTWRIVPTDADHYNLLDSENTGLQSSANPAATNLPGVANQTPQPSANVQAGCGAITNIVYVGAPGVGHYRVSQLNHGLVNGDVIKLTGPAGGVGLTSPSPLDFWTVINSVPGVSYDLARADGTGYNSAGMYTGGGTMHVGCGLLMTSGSPTFQGGTRNRIKFKEERNAASVVRFHHIGVTDNEIELDRWSGPAPSYVDTTLRNRVSGANVGGGPTTEIAYVGTHCFNVLRSSGRIDASETEMIRTRTLLDDGDAHIRARGYHSTFGVTLATPDILNLETTLQIPVNRDAFACAYGRGTTSRNSSNDGNITEEAVTADGWNLGIGSLRNTIVSVVVGVTTAATTQSAHHMRVGQMVQVSACAGTGAIGAMNGFFPVLAVPTDHSFVIPANTTGATYTASSGHVDNRLSALLLGPAYQLGGRYENLRNVTVGTDIADQSGTQGLNADTFIIWLYDVAQGQQTMPIPILGRTLVIVNKSQVQTVKCLPHGSEHFWISSGSASNAVIPIGSSVALTSDGTDWIVN
jgi:hypothetical protein